MQLINYSEKTQTFSLTNNKISYIIQIVNDYPVKRYFGKTIKDFHGSTHLENFSHAFSVQGDADPYSLSTLPFEYSTSDSGDFRVPGYLIKDKHQQYLPILKFSRYEIIDGFEAKHDVLPQLKGKSTDAQTLCLVLADDITGLEITLKYTILAHLPIITKQVVFNNTGKSTLSLTRADSLQLDINGSDFDMLTLTGAHAHEANFSKCHLAPGKTTIDSNYGSSGPQAVPFACLAAPETTQKNGVAIGTTLLWSGNFSFTAEVDQYQNTRLVMGINPETFDWQLKPNTDFTTPVAVLNYSTNGLNDLSQNFHFLFNRYLIKKQSSLLVTFNTWETAYFHVNEKQISSYLRDLYNIGIELFVIDDGWFTNRNGENGQLGDWSYDAEKFPHGLKAISERCHALKMKFGLWIEPEMVTENSKLYQEHPDWILRYVDRDPLPSRHQLVLDLSQPIVQKHIIKVVSNLVKTQNLDYIKWDYNRHFTQAGSLSFSASHQGEISTRYILGLYKVLKTIRDKFPELIIENCSAGGGRLDPGMLFYTDQTWVSDLSDPVYRMEIMNGYSLLFPPNIFVSHITASPNEQDHRVVPLKTRMLLTSVGTTGLEYLPSQFNDQERTEIMKFFSEYKKSRKVFQSGNLFRLTDWPSVEHKVIWLITSFDRSNAFLLISSGLTNPVHTNRYLPLTYLDNDLLYKVEKDGTFSGEELNNAGITEPKSYGDFDSFKIDISSERN